MSVFDGKRLTDKTFKLDIERMRQGWYSDKYFVNILLMLEGVRHNGGYQGKYARNIGCDPIGLNVGDLEVEVQFFTRRRGKTTIVGVDKALSMLRHCTGYKNETGQWVETWQNLEVTAVHDGSITRYDGDALRIQPVIKVNGRYRDFAMLETPMLGILSRSSRIATNVHNVLRAAKGKPVLFFPARFDLHEAQAADGYAYEIAVARFNKDYAGQVHPFISTDAQGDWWGGAGGGTIAHAVIACFLGDTAAAMMAFAAYVPVDVPRIALVDFNNDSIQDSLYVLQQMFVRYAALIDTGDGVGAERYRLYGVRLDTSGSMRDEGVPPLGDPVLDLGVTPRLVFNVRQALDEAWKEWNLSPAHKQMAETYCKAVKIVATGGFNPEKISRFEKLNVPVDIYGVGSSLIRNDKTNNTDFTADVVRVKIDGEWQELAKVGRATCHNPELKRIDLADL